MKRLTMNQVAKANLKHNKKAYFSLAIGIFLAVYLACTAVLCIYGTLEANNEKAARKVGWGDTTLLNEPNVTDDQLRSSGYFDQIGRIYVTASVNDSEVFIGRYDETANDLMYRRCTVGRLPEKPGEIAAERSALDKLELEDANVGDIVTFTLKAFGGTPEKRTFTLVGILTEQTSYMEHTWSFFPEGTGAFPAILTHYDEPGCQYGTPVVHRIMTNRSGVTLTEIQADEILYQLGTAAQISRVSGNVMPYDNRVNDIKEQINQVVLYLILGSALLLSTCVAISSSMESMLAQKTEDIGMLRAVGATKKQIKRLYGRDAWILTLTALPVGAMLGCLTAWIISCLMPNELVFLPTPWLLIPVILISFLCVFLSSMLPLRRASRQLPMGILRDTNTLRKAKKFRNHKQFMATQLIAARQFYLHPMRQAGSACMIALMLFVAILLGEMLISTAASTISNQAAFTLTSRQDVGYTLEPFVHLKSPISGLTQNDLNQLRTLPTVRSTGSRLETQALLLVPDELPSYLKTHYIAIQADAHNRNMPVNPTAGAIDTRYLVVEKEEPVHTFPESLSYDSAMITAKQMHVLQSVLGVHQNIMPIRIIVATLDEVDFSKNIVDGEIDFDALDSGEEILVYAPNVVAKPSNHGMLETNQYFDDEIDPAAWDVVIMNDYFYVGQELNMYQLFGEQPDWFDTRDNEGQLQRFYSEMDTVSFSPKVGAVLKGVFRIGNTRPFGMYLITTEKGAKALGLMDNGAASVSIYLQGDPDIDTEELLNDTIKRIGLRRNMTVVNQLAINREDKEYQTRILMLFGGMVILFFAVAVSMQVTGASRHIRADERMVGTLRAVGADEYALLSCYRLPTIIATAVGYVLAATVYLLMYFLYPIGFPQYHLWLLAVALVLAVLNALCVLLGVRGQLRQVLGKSIVENIREL